MQEQSLKTGGRGALDRFVLVRTSTDSHTSLIVLNVQVYCLSPRSLKLCDRYSFNHARISNAHLLISPLTAILNVAVIEQPDVTSYIP